VSAEVHSPTYDPVVKRLLDRLLELERAKNVDPSEAQYGEHSNQTDNRQAGNVNTATINEHSKLLPWLMMCAILSGVAVTASIVAGIVAWENSKEAKQVQIQLMYANAIFLREGLVQPGDIVYGPEGNLEYRQHELKRKE
jgi:hypothetical protein